MWAGGVFSLHTQPPLARIYTYRTGIRGTHHWQQEQQQRVLSVQIRTTRSGAIYWSSQWAIASSWRPSGPPTPRKEFSTGSPSRGSREPPGPAVTSGANWEWAAKVWLLP